MGFITPWIIFFPLQTTATGTQMDLRNLQTGMTYRCGSGRSRQMNLVADVCLL